MPLVQPRKPGSGSPMPADHRIREGTHGTRDLAVKNWDNVFPPKTCGDCVHRQAGICQTGRRGQGKASDEACISKFERKAGG